MASAWQAAAEAERVFAYAEALTMLARASELWDKVPGAAQRAGTSHDRLLERAARVAHLLHEDERARAFVSASLREIDTPTEPARAASLLELRARLQPDPRDGIADLHEALSLVSDGRHERERAAVLATLAMKLGKAGAPAQARAPAEEALKLAEAGGDLATQASALTTLAMLGHTEGPGCSDADLGMLARARSVAAQAGDYHLMLNTTINESHVLEGIGAHKRAAQVARDGIAEAARYGLARTQGTFLTINLAEPLHSLGRWDEATDVIERALDLAAPSATRAALLQLAGLIAVARGDVQAAGRAEEAAARFGAAVRYEAQLHLPLARLRIDLLTAQRRYRQALDAARDVMRRCDLQQHPRYAWPVMAAAARAAAEVAVAPAAARDADSADAAGDLLAALATEAAKLETESPVQRAHQLTYAAEVLRAGHTAAGGPPGPVAQAAAWEQAAAAWDEVGEPYPRAVALFRAAEAALASGGSRDAAAAALRQAAETASVLGAQPLGEAVALLGRRARIPAGDDGGGAASAPAGGLTPRELEVLRLVAAGMSNARIATELFISPKTASVHVSNILSKLGASSRGEAAAAAHELRLLDAG
jgi:DNA-binding CsgD family transcriptional regulator/tetratricopeptide (TPR) repeat protein